jgi:SAM-dependent methyltransferase
MTSPYDHHFYAEQIEGSLSSARVITGLLADLWRPASVLDIGCGRGAWLKAWHERGVLELHGIDGPWNRGADLLESAIAFRAANLEQPLQGLPPVDLAMSIEVVEHLTPEAGASVVDALTRAADVVLFSAAFSGQGGVMHQHERYHSHWGRLFRERGFASFDAFRPRVWSDPRVAPWHRANVFLHVRDGHALTRELPARGVPALADLGFMDAVHPWLYERWREPGLRGHLRALGPSLLKALRRR